MEPNIVGNFNELLKSGIYLIFVGIMLILIAGVSAGGGYLIMEKLDGDSRSWVETFIPSIVFFTLISFAVGVTAFGIAASDGMPGTGILFGFLVMGFISLLIVEPTVWLAQFLDGDRTNFAGFSWIIWAIGVLTSASGAYWLLPCGGGFCTNDNNEDDEDRPPVQKWYENMSFVITGACLLAFVIRLEEKVEDGSEHSYVKVWIPYMVLCGWQVLGMILNFAIMVSEGSSTIAYARKIFGNVISILASVYVGVTLPLYLDGDINEGWEVVLPSFISSGLYAIVGIFLIIVGSGVVMGNAMAENGEVTIGNIIHGVQNRPNHEAQNAQNIGPGNDEFSNAIDALNDVVQA